MDTTSGGVGYVESGISKLQCEDFEYYMQTHSIILGRNSKKSTVDVDLSSLDSGMNISRHHARIFYDFPRRRFALEVLGKNECFVEGVLHLPERKADNRSRIIDQESDNQLLMQLKEKDMVSSVAAVLSDLCGPGEWMPMEKLHSELVDQYSDIWQHSQVRRYLTSVDWSTPK